MHNGNILAHDCNIQFACEPLLNMNKEEIKHIDELYKASWIIEELGFEPNVTMCSDRPDLVLPSLDDPKIGIEVVTYSSHLYEEAEDALYKILEEYTLTW